jgi:hypothetical protein
VLLFSAATTRANTQAGGLEAALELSAGYRQDNLDFNIAGSLAGTNPNVLSDVAWSDLDIYQFKAALRASFNEAFYMRGSLARGWIFGGNNVDSDFLGNNRTLEFSRSNNSADDGSVWDATLGVGYPFKFASKRLRVIPLVGYSFSVQNLTLTDGFQTVSLPPSGQPVGPIAGLNSTYETEWRGPWIGVDLSWAVTDRITLLSSFEYHWATYEAVANWNLRSDLLPSRSFEHDADGRGIVASAGAEYLLKESWYVGLNVTYQEWSTDHGVDRVFLADGRVLETRLNEVNWDSFAVFAGVTYRFQW